jgi:hypothetical protein
MAFTRVQRRRFVSEKMQALERGRAGHTMVYDASNASIIVIGGYPLSVYEPYVSMFTYTIATNEYTIVKEHSTFSMIDDNAGTLAGMRFEHSAVLHNNVIYVYGGMLGDQKTITNTFMSYDLRAVRPQWQPVDVANVTQQVGVHERALHPSDCLQPLNVSGHTAHVIDNRMYTFLGYSPLLYYTNAVQMYDFGEMSSMSGCKLTRAIFKYRHTSMVDGCASLDRLHISVRSTTDGTTVQTFECLRRSHTFGVGLWRIHATT